MTYRMICEFENTLAGHQGQVGTPNGGVIFQPGKCGQGVQVAEATTNLVTNPSFEVNVTDGWAYATITATRKAGGASGSYCLNAVGTGASSQFYTSAIAVTNATAYTASFWYKTASTVVFQVIEYGTSTYYGQVTLPAATEWTRYSLTLTTPAASSTNCRLVWNGISVGENIDVDGVQFEQKAYLTPYCDGSLGTGHSWSGTAHASTSARTGAALTYPVAALDVAEGAVSLWANLASLGRYCGLFSGSNSSTPLAGYVTNTGVLGFRMSSIDLMTGVLVSAGSWYHYVFTWSASQNKREIYVNGVLAASRQYDAGATLNGCYPFTRAGTLGDYSVNGVGDQFVVCDRALTAAEVATVYNGGAGLGYYDLLYALEGPATFTVAGRFGSDWVDLSNYTKSMEWGLGFSAPYETIARSETLKITLLNSDRRFSPEYTGSPLYPNFTRGKSVRVLAVTTNGSQLMFSGKIDNITPLPDVRGERTTTIECTGFLQECQDAEVSLPVQENKRTDEIIRAILAAANVTPPSASGSWILGMTGASELNSTTYLGDLDDLYVGEIGKATLAIFGDQWESTSVYGALRDTVNQEYGRLFVNRDGQVIFWNRHHIFANPTTNAAVSEGMLKTMGYSYGADIINEALVKAQPRTVGSVDEVLGRLASGVLLKAGETKSITMRYIDPATELTITGKNAIAPVGVTDFHANTMENGAGQDYTASVSAVIEEESANSSNVRFTNGSIMEVWLLAGAQIRGIKITASSEITVTKRDDASVAAYRLKRWTYPAAVESLGVAEGMAEYILATRKEPRGNISEIDFAPVKLNANSIILAMVLANGIGTRISLSETQTGADADYFVIGESFKVENNMVAIKWQLEPANYQNYWQLGYAGFGELGGQTYLAIF